MYVCKTVSLFTDCILPVRTQTKVLYIWYVIRHNNSSQDKQEKTAEKKKKKKKVPQTIEYIQMQANKTEAKQFSFCPPLFFVRQYR